MLQTLTFSGAAGRVINAQAIFFRYESGSAGGADESIKVRANGSDLGTYLPGDSITLPEAAQYWEIVPTIAACVGVVRLGMGVVSSARLVGNVRVIDSNTDKSRAGRQFWNAYTAPASAGNVKWPFLVAVGGEMAIKRLMIGSAIPGILDIATGATGGTVYTLATKFGLLNKYILTASSTVAKVGEGISVLATPTAGELPGYINLGGIYVQANTLVEVPLTTPIILKDGQMLLVGSRVVNRDVQIVADVEEI